MKKNKKRLISIVCSIIFLFIGCLCVFSGCVSYIREEEIESQMENDGLFKYWRDYGAEENKSNGPYYETYAICGIVVQRLPETVYIPSYFNGMRISYLSLNFVSHGWYSHTRLPSAAWAPSFNGVKKIYLPNTLRLNAVNNAVSGYIDTNNDISYLGNDVKELYVVRFIISEELDFFTETSLERVYVTGQRFDRLINTIGFQSLNNYQIIMSDENRTKVIQKANVIFNYNYYDNEDDIYLVDNSEGNELLTKPPHDPFIAGKTFDGWYKEPEYINAWDFENDLTPALEYDSDGKLIFKETKLYAKWVEN